MNFTSQLDKAKIDVHQQRNYGRVTEIEIIHI